VLKFNGNEPGGLAVYILTLRASIGHNNTSAIHSAEADANDHTIFLLFVANSYPKSPPYTSLNIS